MALNPFTLTSNTESEHLRSKPHPTTPPPPYESVVSNEASPFIPKQSESKDFEVIVSDPVKQGEGVSAYVSYKVKTKTSLEQYSSPQSEVIRRFRDFAWLHDRLVEKNKGFIVPPLPEKNAVQKFSMATEFIEQRRRALQVFINKVAAHPMLKFTKELQLFLEAPEDEWVLEVARTQVEANAANKQLNNAVKWFQAVQLATQSLVQGKSDDALEDPEYLKVKAYVTNLETHLAEAHRQATRLIKKEMERGLAIGDFGQAAEKLGRFEEGSLQGAFTQLATRAQRSAASAKARTEELTNNFEAPLKEFSRTVKSVQTTIQDRSVALAHLQQSKQDMDSKKVKLNKLRATPGTKADKIAEAERELNEADQRAQQAKMTYETIVARMTEELNRFQRERSADMCKVLSDFAVTQAIVCSEQAKIWGSLLTELQHLSK